MKINLTPDSTRIDTIGKAGLPSTLKKSVFVPDAARVRYQSEYDTGADLPADIVFEKAGPREKVFFDPAKTRAAIVTCGGICPGLNNVIRSAFLEFHYNYGVREVWGIRYGYAGMNPAVGQPPVLLTPEIVSDIHREGGTILGSSRGPQEASVQVDFLIEKGINILLCVGGDGTQRGARAIAAEAMRRNVPMAVVGIPKTIDNDVLFVSRTFGVVTAMEKAREVLECAHAEACSAFNGVGLVKVMGREAGYIAAGATLASQEVNFTLVPEVSFALDGENGLISLLGRRLEDRRHAVIVVAEGAGQDLLKAHAPEGTDASGNKRLGDIGLFLKEQIVSRLKQAGMAVDVKYFDPSYFIRSTPANCEDSLLCDQFARHAVHAAMAGKTNLLIGIWNGLFTHVPIPMAVMAKKQIDVQGRLWNSVIAATGQPVRIG